MVLLVVVTMGKVGLRLRREWVLGLRHVKRFRPSGLEFSL